MGIEQHQKNSTGAPACPCGPGLWAVTALSRLPYLHPMPSQAARSQGHEDPHTSVQKEGISGRILTGASTTSQPNAMQERRGETLSLCFLSVESRLFLLPSRICHVIGSPSAMTNRKSNKSVFMEENVPEDHCCVPIRQGSKAGKTKLCVAGRTFM